MSKRASGEELADTVGASPSGATATGGGQLASPAGSPRELRAGDVLERYEIVGVLGAGGMGRVYRARDPDLNRDLAIKVLRRSDGGGGSGGLERRLLREAQAMAKLSHPNLATVYDVGTFDGEVFIAFELVDGPTLGAWARAGHTVAERLGALVAAGRGLEAAHSAGVIHRDFKPDNVLVGRDGVVKVVDFGLARGVGDARAEPGAVRSDELAVDLTQTGSILGTPAYMAPEQHHGMVADARADQFGFAVTAWEVLHGERPFRGSSITALAAAICSGDITPPPPNRDVTPAVEAVLRRALEVEPDRRYPDMTALLAALAPPPTITPPRSVWRDWRVAAISFGMVLIALGAVYVGYVTNRVTETKPETTPDPKATGPLAGIRAVLLAKRHEVDECYDRAQMQRLELPAGTVKLSVDLSATGTVVSTKIVSDDFDGELGIASCVAARTLAMTFPAPPGGNGAGFTYPFHFEPRTFELERTDDDFTLSAPVWDWWLSRLHATGGAGAQLVPTERDGKQIGYKLFAIEKASLPALLGFENGDTVTHVNGHALDSATAFPRMLPELMSAKRIEVRLTRRAKPVTLAFTRGPDELR
ncbi:MAG: protein kinase [Deltaproteobacteria bacterium]|nr:protein kinase [Kofleriaceae bacterium]